MKYLKIFTDFVIDMEALGDAERGRLFTAMLLYAETGEDVELKGNERFIWAKSKAIGLKPQMAESDGSNFATKKKEMRRVTSPVRKIFFSS